MTRALDVRTGGRRSCIAGLYCPRRAALCTTLGLAVIFLFSAAQLPSFFEDPQYYVQSAMLWPRGELTFAASWLGNRDVVVLLYYLAFKVFGTSLDALSISLATILLIANAAIGVAIFSLLNAPLAAALFTSAAGFLFATLHSGVSPVMQSPASDNIAVMSLACLWAAWVVGHRCKMPGGLCLLIGVVSGIATHIRPELVLFPVISALIAIPSSRLGWFSLLKKAAFCVLGFAIGVAIPHLSWPVWVGAPKPYAYTGAFLVYYPFDEFARGVNGPASQELAKQLNLSPASRIPFWDAIAVTYSRLGPKLSDRLITDAGIEAIENNPTQWLVNGLRSSATIALSQGSVSVGQKSWSEKKAGVAEVLDDFDQDRVESSAQFGNDATAQTRALADRQLSFVSALRSIIPSVQITVTLPGLVGVLTPVLVLALRSRLTRRDMALLLPLPVYGIFVLILGAFTNGAHPRYFAPLLGFDLLICALACTRAVLGQRRPTVSSGTQPTN